MPSQNNEWCGVCVLTLLTFVHVNQPSFSGRGVGDHMLNGGGGGPSLLEMRGEREGRLSVDAACAVTWLCIVQSTLAV